MDVCTAPNCDSSYKKTPGISLFRFPKKDRERCEKWRINCRGKHLDGMTHEQLYKSRRLCNKHFEDSQFMHPKYKDSLVWSAIPTLFDVPNPPKTITPKRPLPIRRHRIDQSTKTKSQGLSRLCTVMPARIESEQPGTLNLQCKRKDNVESDVLDRQKKNKDTDLDPVPKLQIVSTHTSFGVRCDVKREFDDTELQREIHVKCKPGDIEPSLDNIVKSESVDTESQLDIDVKCEPGDIESQRDSDIHYDPNYLESQRYNDVKCEPGGIGQQCDNYVNCEPIDVDPKREINVKRGPGDKEPHLASHYSMYITDNQSICKNVKQEQFTDDEDDCAYAKPFLDIVAVQSDENNTNSNMSDLKGKKSESGKIKPYN